MINDFTKYVINENDRLRQENARLTNELIELSELIGYHRGMAQGEWHDVVPEEYKIPGYDETMAALDKLTLTGDTK